MYTMIGGATSAGAGRCDRRMKHSREKSFMEKLGRPSKLLLKPGASHPHTPDNSVPPSRYLVLVSILNPICGGVENLR